VRDFLSELHEPPETEAEQHRMTSILHALDHAGRLLEVAGEGGRLAQADRAAYDLRTAVLCTQAMRAAQAIAGSITSEHAFSAQAAPIGWSVSPEVGSALAQLQGAAKDLDTLRREQRAATLAAVAPGKLTAVEAFARIDAVQRLDRIAHHAWRASAHLLGRG
jgi:phosphate:Na+ symporter